MFIVWLTIAVIFYFFSLLYPRMAFVLLGFWFLFHLTQEPWLAVLALPLAWFGLWIDHWSIQFMHIGINASKKDDDDDYTDQPSSPFA